MMISGFCVSGDTSGVLCVEDRRMTDSFLLGLKLTMHSLSAYDISGLLRFGLMQAGTSRFCMFIVPTTVNLSLSGSSANFTSV